MATGTDLRSKLPLREHIRNIKRMLGFVKQIDRNYFRFMCVVQMLNVGIPYIELLLSARILDLISAGGSFREMMGLAAAAVLGILLLHYISSTANNRMEVRRSAIVRLYENSVEAKILNMDFSRIDSPEVKVLQDRIRIDNNWGGGAGGALGTGNAILRNLWDIAGAVIVGAPIAGYLLRFGGVTVWLLLAAVLALSAGALYLRAYYRRMIAEYRYSEYTDDADREEKFTFCWDFAEGVGFHYKNARDIRIYGSYGLMKRWTTEVLEHQGFRDMTVKGAKGDAGNAFLSGALTGMIEGASYLIVVLTALAGGITVGNVVRFAGAFSRMLHSLKELMDKTAEFALSARKQLSTLELIELRDEMYKGKLPVEKRSDNEYEIEFRRVSFRYPGATQYALKDFSMKLKVGEKLAIVGMNGSGKTTMIKLLCRLYDPQEGEILLNGVDIRKYKQEEYRQLFSVVFQDFRLFPFPLGENVAVNRSLNPARVVRCLEEAGFGERLSRLDKSLDTYLYKKYDDGGVEISGGEEQKIAIARAIYKDSPFILLDEPTAALDPLAEYEIYTHFDRIVGDKTAIYISHRLSSCRFCGKIAVFHEGALVQLGTHEELLAQRYGKYREMWESQAQYYRDGGREGGLSG